MSFMEPADMLQVPLSLRRTSKTSPCFSCMMVRAPGLIKVRGPSSFRDCPREESSNEWGGVVISSPCCVSEGRIPERQRKKNVRLEKAAAPDRGDEMKNAVSFSGQVCFSITKQAGSLLLVMGRFHLHHQASSVVIQHGSSESFRNYLYHRIPRLFP